MKKILQLFAKPAVFYLSNASESFSTLSPPWENVIKDPLPGINQNVLVKWLDACNENPPGAEDFSCLTPASVISKRRGDAQRAEVGRGKHECRPPSGQNENQDVMSEWKDEGEVAKAYGWQRLVSKFKYYSRKNRLKRNNNDSNNHTSWWETSPVLNQQNIVIIIIIIIIVIIITTWVG